MLDKATLILAIYATEEIAGDDVEGGCRAVDFAFGMIADAANEALAFHLHIDRCGHDDLNAAEESMDVDFLILRNSRFAQVQADASGEGVEPGTVACLAMLDVFVASVVHRAADAPAVLTDGQRAPQPFVGVAAVAVHHEICSYI